uniref:Uncharacterized protein n=1 Tax=Dipteran tombus-related virus TaxID=2822553 RepID=A0A8A6RHA6_9TOMB|nr:hypothetical protein [Dipteran tombus-related virus]
MNKVWHSVKSLFSSSPTLNEIESQNLQQTIDNVINQRRLDTILNANRAAALAYLRVKTIGKKIDKAYIQLCGTLLNEYCDEKGISDYQERVKLSDNLIREHIYTILKQRPIFDEGTTLRAREYNDEIQGVAYKWTLFGYRKIPLEEPENLTPPRPVYAKSIWKYLGMIGLATTTIIAGHKYISQRSIPIDTCTTQITNRLLGQGTLTGTNPSYLQSIGQMTLNELANTSARTCATLLHGVVSATLKVWETLVKLNNTPIPMKPIINWDVLKPT